MSEQGQIRVGIGGWVFPPWRGTFYPKDVKQADESTKLEDRADGVDPQPAVLVQPGVEVALPGGHPR